jgi:PIN domain nuclease of toxin-antitoxin system
MDACGLLAVLNREVGAEPVKALLEESPEKVAIFMNVVNLLEVYYGILRKSGREFADETFMSIKSGPIVVVDVISDKVFREAVRN